MRNLKKMAALGAAAVMALSMNVSAFAAATSTAKASYSGGKVLLSSLADIDATHQWTVVVIDVADQNANLTADKLYYINQGTSGDAFWTDGMGTKTELKDGDYIVRIGGETIDTTDKLIEIPLKVSTTPTGEKITFLHGDVNANGAVNISDAGAIVSYVLGVEETFTSPAEKQFKINSTYGNTLWGDVNLNGAVNISDAGAIVSYVLGVEETFGNNVKIGNSITEQINN